MCVCACVHVCARARIHALSNVPFLAKTFFLRLTAGIRHRVSTKMNMMIPRITRTKLERLLAIITMLVSARVSAMSLPGPGKLEIAAHLSSHVHTFNMDPYQKCTECKCLH